jgi:hypothetical protein
MARTRVFRSALGTSAFVVARRRLSLCMSWIVAIKDNPELSRRGALLLAQMRQHLDRGAPVDADLLAARVAFEHYMRTWLTECRSGGFAPDELCAGMTSTWKAFVDQNVAAEKAHHAQSVDDAFRRGFATAAPLASQRQHPDAVNSAANEVEPAVLERRTLIDRFRRRDDGATAEASFDDEFAEITSEQSKGPSQTLEKIPEAAPTPELPEATAAETPYQAAMSELAL